MTWQTLKTLCFDFPTDVSESGIRNDGEDKEEDDDDGEELFIKNALFLLGVRFLVCFSSPKLENSSSVCIIYAA